MVLLKWAEQSAAFKGLIAGAKKNLPKRWKVIMEQDSDYYEKLWIRLRGQFFT